VIAIFILERHQHDFLQAEYKPENSIARRLAKPRNPRQPIQKTTQKAAQKAQQMTIQISIQTSN
jgi:hypothetical protein